MACSWKPNWHEARKHYIDWWHNDGLVVRLHPAPPADPPHDDVDPPPMPANIEERYTNASWRARHNHAALAKHTYPWDNLPLADTMIGPGSLALLVGCEPGFSRETVWFEPSMQDVASPEDLPPLQFDPENGWWKAHEKTLRESAEYARGKYIVGCPDLVENVDILAALRDPQTLMVDMIERPDWIEEKVEEINQVFFEAYQRIYDIIKLEDGSSAFAAFGLWGPGKTVKVQCDAAAMFSPDMFARFVVPALTEQCAWLDHAMFHLDGTQCIVHLDELLHIEPLDAVEWTPQSGIEGGGSPRWYDMYRKILAAGKAVQAVGVQHDEIIPLLDAVGGKGMHIVAQAPETEEELDRLLDRIETYR